MHKLFISQILQQHFPISISQNKSSLPFPVATKCGILFSFKERSFHQLIFRSNYFSYIPDLLYTFMGILILFLVVSSGMIFKLKSKNFCYFCGGVHGILLINLYICLFESIRFADDSDNIDRADFK